MPAYNPDHDITSGPFPPQAMLLFMASILVQHWFWGAGGLDYSFEKADVSFGQDCSLPTLDFFFSFRYTD